jgi:hypothetical protein
MGSPRWETFDGSDWITDRDELVSSMRGAQHMERLRARLTGNGGRSQAA